MPPQGEGGGGIFSAVGSLLSGLFGFGGENNQFSQIQQQGNQAVQTFLQTQITSLFSQLKNLAQVVLRALRHILDDIIHLRFLHLLQDYEALKEKIKAWARRHPTLLRFLRGILHPTQTALIGRVLNLIQHLRQLLLIFRIFHLRFATTLDNILLRVEARVIRNSLAIVRKVNEISTLLNLLFDPLQVIRRNPIFAVFTRALDSWFKLLTGHGFNDRVNRAAPPGLTGPRPLMFEVVRSQLFAVAAGQQSDYTDVGAQAVSVFDRTEQEIGGREEV